MPQDWFADNAPKDQSGDWFSKNAPAAPGPSKTEADYYREHPEETVTGFGKNVLSSAGQAFVNTAKGLYQQGKNIINPPSTPEAKYNAQHAFDSIDPSIILPRIKEAWEKRDLKTLSDITGSLAAQATLAGAGGAEGIVPEAGTILDRAATTVLRPLAAAADATSRVTAPAMAAAKVAVPTLVKKIPIAGKVAQEMVQAARDKAAEQAAQVADEATRAEIRKVADPLAAAHSQPINLNLGDVLRSPETPRTPPVASGEREGYVGRNAPVVGQNIPLYRFDARIPLWKRTAVPTEEPSSVTVQDILQKPSVGSKLDAGQPITLEDLQKFGKESAPLKMRSVEPEDYTSVLQEMLNMKPAELRQRVADFTRRKPKK